jgi:hypothetical protein
MPGLRQRHAGHPRPRQDPHLPVLLVLPAHPVRHHRLRRPAHRHRRDRARSHRRARQLLPAPARPHRRLDRGRAGDEHRRRGRHAQRAGRDRKSADQNRRGDSIGTSRRSRTAPSTLKPSQDDLLSSRPGPGSYASAATNSPANSPSHPRRRRPPHSGKSLSTSMKSSARAPMLSARRSSRRWWPTSGSQDPAGSSPSSASPRPREQNKLTAATQCRVFVQ